MEQTTRLRAVEPGDLDFMYRMECQPDVWRVSWGETPVSRQMLWRYIDTYTADIYADRQLRLVIECDGTAVGTVDISDYDPSNGRAMIGIAVDAPWRRRGIAAGALAEAIAYCRETLGMHQLAAMVARDNPESMRLFEKLGFKTAGCLRSWLRRGRTYVDVVILQLML